MGRRSRLPYLHGRMVQMGMTMEDLAEEICIRSREPGFPGGPIDIKKGGIYNRFSGETEWRLTEAIAVCRVLDLPEDLGLMAKYLLDEPDTSKTSQQARRRGRSGKMPPVLPGMEVTL